MVYDHNDNSPVLSPKQRHDVRRYALSVMADIATPGNDLVLVLTSLDEVYVINREDSTVVRALPEAETAVHSLVARELVEVLWNHEIRLRDNPDHTASWAF